MAACMVVTLSFATCSLMDAATTIRHSLSRVVDLRAQAAASRPLQTALQHIKQFQARRFAGTYQDLLRSPTFAAPTGFFLNELYGVRDFSDRDAQFARIASALQTFFPKQVVATAVALAELHALTEELDLEMAHQYLQLHAHASRPMLDGSVYLKCWKSVANPALRLGQLQSVLEIGRELDNLTRTKGLRMTLRMMRGPARAAGLQALQSFLEVGFDTFASMGGEGQQTKQFLRTIHERETAWIEKLFNSPPSLCEAELEACLARVL